LSSPANSGGTILMIDWPIISSAAYPKTRAAAGFQCVTILFRSLERIASSAFCTMAARYCSANCDGSRGFDIEARTDFELADLVDASSNCLRPLGALFSLECRIR